MDNFLFRKYSHAEPDKARAPKNEVPFPMRHMVGDFWTLPIDVPVAELQMVKATAISTVRLRSIKSAAAVPPIEIAVSESGHAELLDGNHRLVAARKRGDVTIIAIFTFPE